MATKMNFCYRPHLTKCLGTYWPMWYITRHLRTLIQKTDDFDVRDKTREKNLKLQFCKHCWTMTTFKYNHNRWKCSMWSRKMLASVCTRWKRFKRGENEYHTIWLKDREISKSHRRTSLKRHQRKNFLCRNATGDKSIYLEDPKRRKSWINPLLPSTSTARLNRL